MAREYVDMHVEKMDERMASTMARMGFRHVCAVDVKALGKEADLGVSVYRKVFLEVSSRGELLQLLKNCGKKVVVGVKPLTREALMVAARDGRVGTIMVHGEMAEIDRHVAKVLKNCLEITVSEIAESFEESRRWRNLLKIVRAAEFIGTPIIVSSGASCETELLPPHQMAYMLASMRSLNRPDLDAVSTTPLKLLRQVVG
ncbi:MAG: hypothetical protein RMH74_06610 [Candidatus Caldarchaeum sp.]|nr:hypothetical protein [Candidatus Caldarchaeum sp.]